MNGANLIRVAGELVRVWQWDVVEQALHSFTHAIVGHSGTTRKRHPRGTHRHTQSRTLAISSRWLGSTSSSLPMSRPRCSASIRSSVAWGRISSIKSPSRWTVSPYAQPAPTPTTQHDANVRLLEATWESTQHGAPTAAVSADSATCTLPRCSAAKESTKSHAGISLPLSLVACPLAFPLALPLALLEPMASTPAPELHATACQMQHCAELLHVPWHFLRQTLTRAAHQHTHCAPASFVCGLDGNPRRIHAVNNGLRSVAVFARPVGSDGHCTPAKR